MHFDSKLALAWLALGGLGYFQVFPNIILCSIALLATLACMIKRIDDYVPYAEITALIATLQWVFMPMLGYIFETPIQKYRMYVGEEFYFSFALPAVCCMNAMLLSIRRLKDPVGRAFRLEYSPKVLRHVAMLLITAGLASALVSGRVPGSLGFVFHLLSQLTYVAVLILVYHEVPRSRWMLVLAVAPLILGAGRTAMFHSLLLWCCFFGIFWLRSRPRSHAFKMQFIAIGIAGVLAVQFFKGAYREELMSQRGSGRLEAMVSVVSLDLFTREESWMNGVVRFNQGWIISAILDNVPSREPYANGATLQDAIVAAIFPRFIMSTKKAVGGGANFRRYTGLPIGKGTSMGISPLGEAWANFGKEGGIALMFCWGAILSLFIIYLNRLAASRPMFHFLIPLILYQGIKAETEFLVIFNQLTKGLMLSLIVYWGMKHYGNISFLKSEGTLRNPHPPSDATRTHQSTEHSKVAKAVDSRHETSDQKRRA
ncbi:hypothetical protein Mal33_53560 [Rosistilla oblonga]|uniref:Uncharacterized protein n=1 Tax=Rosistilla oblonga TaxID=2527990 RepID=A0A518J1W9_9BACT|nr:hypothetical protein Mal33_53560 [Rosistilla oblonga]